MNLLQTRRDRITRAVCVLPITAVLAAAAIGAAPVAADAQANPDMKQLQHAVPPGAQGTGSLIVYSMPGATREKVTASELVFIPKGEPPSGGWPVAVWFHGNTTPGSSKCAPSLWPEFDGGLTASGFKSDYDFHISSLVNNGYAVVAPDYEGLGANADSPYPGYYTKSLLNSGLFGLRAAKELYPSLSNRYVTVGHSEGAKAVVAFDQFAREASPSDLRHMGSVAVAPFSSLRVLLQGLEQARAHVPPADVLPVVATQNFLVAMLATSIQVQKPDYDLQNVMGPDLTALLPRLRELCTGPAIQAVTAAVRDKGIDQFRGVRDGWIKDTTMAQFLKSNDPAEMENLTVAEPMLVIGGTKDNFVPAGPLTKLVDKLRSKGADITFDLMTDGDHFTLLRGEQPKILEFIGKAFNNK
jgi:acetyl esterase/lipase